MGKFNNSFSEFISFFPEELKYRAMELIFLNSGRVKSLNDYYSLKDSEIDFKWKLRDKSIKKVSNESYPLVRSTQKSFFRSNEIFVHQGVFIPRPETEVLVEVACDWIKKLKLSNFSYLDLCSGAGNILISILGRNMGKISKYGAVDCSFLSCRNTFKNVSRIEQQLSGNIYCTNWTDFLCKYTNWDVITINPPYVGQGGKEEFQLSNLYKYDPKWALQAGQNGWSHYQKIVAFASKNTNWKLIIAECSEFHENMWDNLELSNKKFQIKKYKDYLGKFRVVVLSQI